MDETLVGGSPVALPVSRTDPDRGNHAKSHFTMEDLADAPDYTCTFARNDYAHGVARPRINSLEHVGGLHSFQSGPTHEPRAQCLNKITNFSIHLANQEASLRDLASEMETTCDQIKTLEEDLSVSESGLREMPSKIADLTARENCLHVVLEK